MSTHDVQPAWHDTEQTWPRKGIPVLVYSTDTGYAVGHLKVWRDEATWEGPLGRGLSRIEGTYWRPLPPPPPMPDPHCPTEASA